ncbi:MAG: SPFH domain-containing protein [Prevotella sp.]|nr:SPFH domain-containing protein [Prevotella sp.]
MGLFSRGNSGGMMNVIRCDEQEYMVWKWRPEGQEANSTSRENSIRYGSSVRVKDGEVAVFVYKQKDGSMQDFIEGPFDETIKTANFPVLASIVGMAFGGESPFQAEVYFINLQSNNQLRFAVPYFDVFDPRLPDHGVPMAVRGTITFNITDYRGFIKLNRLINFDHEQFMKQIKAALSKYVKAVVTNVPQEMGIPVVQMERQILNINEKVEAYLKPRIEEDFGVNLKGLDISALEIDKESPYYGDLRQLTAGNTARTMNAQTDVNIQNLKDTQRINAENMEETMRIQREEAQRAQRLQTETNFMGAHALDQQTEVLKAGAQSLGQMGNMDGGGSGGGMNPAGMMTGMMMGGAMGQQMAGMMQNMGQQMQGAMNTPPPMPNVQYHISVNGAQAGPFNMQQMAQMVQGGQLTQQTYVWKQGMANWELAGNVQELASLFAPPASGATPPPPPVS